MSQEYVEYMTLASEKDDLEKSGDYSSDRYLEIENRMQELFRELSASEREFVEFW